MTKPLSAPVVNFLAGPYLDRRSEEREQPEAIARARVQPGSRVLLAQGTRLAVTGDPPRAAFFPADEPSLQLLPDEAFILLGWYQEEPCLLLPAVGGSTLELISETSWRFEELRPLTATLERHEAGLLAYARALAYWQMRHRHCGRCGGPSAPQRAGHVMQCLDPQCGEVFFPRLDPAVIVLVQDEDRALLGRQPSWPEGRFSTIAGFVEPGESLEDAVAREVAEETGVSLRSLRYHSSQPWPFPSSLMLGFLAEANDTRIQVGCELAEAQWFTRDDIIQQKVILPPSTSISFSLIENWFDTDSAAPLRSIPTASWMTTRKV